MTIMLLNLADGPTVPPLPGLEACGDCGAWTEPPQRDDDYPLFPLCVMCRWRDRVTFAWSDTTYADRQLTVAEIVNKSRLSAYHKFGRAP